MKKVVASMAAITVIMMVGLTLASVASAAQEHHPVTICHRTNSVTNPYVKITVDDDAVDGIGGSDHFGEHLGPIFDPAFPPPPPHNGDQWGDIIPPVADDGFDLGHDGRNWPAGAALLAANCDFPDEQPEVEASLSTPSCPNPNIVATGNNPTDAQVTFDVLVDGVLVDSFIVAANSTGTSASIPVTDGDVVTVEVQGAQTVLDTVTVDLDCETTTPPPCPTGTKTITVTSTAPPVTETVTTTVTVTKPPAAPQSLQDEEEIVPVEDCEETVTETVTPTITETVTNTITTSVPPVENPTASLSTPTCPNKNIVATGVNPTDAQITFDVFVNGVLVDSFIAAANSQGTSASIPVKDNDVVTVKVQGGQTVLATLTVNLDCDTTSPPKDESPPTSPTVRPTTVEPSKTDSVGPTTVSPGGTAFTGVENVVPLGAIALMLMSGGSGLLWAGSRRRKQDQNQDEE